VEDAEKAHQLGSVVTRITEQATFIVINNTGRNLFLTSNYL
jgi:hypothetical protein